MNGEFLSFIFKIDVKEELVEWRIESPAGVVFPFVLVWSFDENHAEDFVSEPRGLESTLSIDLAGAGAQEF